MLQTAFDDSGKDGLSRSFVLAGYFGTPEKLMDLADAWQGLLKKEPSLEYVKGFEAFNLQNQFDGWTEQARDQRLLEFVALIAKHTPKGIAFVVDNKPFSLIKNVKDDEGHFFKDSYNFAYRLSFSFFLQSLPDFGQTIVDMVFDYDLISRRQAIKAYKEIFQKWPDLAKRLWRKEPHWESDNGDRGFLPLQAADLLAYCVRANRDPGKRGDAVRRSPVLAALRTINTGIAAVEEKQLQYLRDRQEKHIERQQMFTLIKW